MTVEEANLPTEELPLEAEAAPMEDLAPRGPGHEVVAAEGDEGVVDSEEPVYEPNFGFEVQGEKKEFDEWARELVKDKESEEFYRDIMHKVHGIEHIKSTRDHLKQTLEEERGRKQALDSSLKTLSHYVETGNFESFFDALQISEQDVLQYAAKRLQYRDMSPEQQAQYDSQIHQSQNNYQLQQQNLQLQQNNSQIIYDQRMRELDLVMSRPDVQQAMTAFETRLNKPGAFREEVLNRGRYHATVNGTDPSAETVVNEVIGLIGGDYGSQQSTPSQAPQQGVTPTPQNKPVIPKVNGSGASPARKVPRSIADLKAITQGRP